MRSTRIRVGKEFPQIETAENWKRLTTTWSVSGDGRGLVACVGRLTLNASDGLTWKNATAQQWRRLQTSYVTSAGLDIPTCEMGERGYYFAAFPHVKIPVPSMCMALKLRGSDSIQGCWTLFKSNQPTLLAALLGQEHRWATSVGEEDRFRGKSTGFESHGPGFHGSSVLGGGCPWASHITSASPSHFQYRTTIFTLQGKLWGSEVLVKYIT